MKFNNNCVNFSSYAIDNVELFGNSELTLLIDYDFLKSGTLFEIILRVKDIGMMEASNLY